MATAYQIFQAETDPYKRGIAYAIYQTEGLAERHADTVRAWRRAAMTRAKSARSETKATLYKGEARGYSDWLLRVAG